MLNSSGANIIKEAYKSVRTLNIVNVLSSVLITLLLLYINFTFDIGIYLVGLIIGLLLTILIINYPKIWLYTFAIMIGLFFHSRSDGVSVLDAVSAAFFNGSIYIWFVNKVFIQKEKAALNLGDWLILAFFIFLLFNSVVSFFNDATMLIWIREYLMISIILIYFPLRSVIKNQNELKKLMIFLMFVIIGVGMFQGYLYYTKLNELIIQYAFELNTGVNINQTLYTTASIFGFVFTFNQLKRKYEISMMLFTGIAIISLIATFSRTFWVILAVFIAGMFLFFPINKKVKILNYLIVVSLIFFVLAYLLMKENLFIYLQVVLDRFTSSAAGKKDMSVLARLAEWEEVIKLILKNPLGGNGIGTMFKFYTPIELFTITTDIIHNGYLFILYRVGIPLSVIFFSFHIYYTILSYDNMVKSIKIGENFNVALSISTFAGFLILYVVNTTSSQYFYRDGIIVIALLVTFAHFNGTFLRSEQAKSDEIIEN